MSYELKAGDFILVGVEGIRQLHTGWTEGDGTGHEGYHLEDFFDKGRYKGPDQHGIEPTFRDYTDSEVEEYLDSGDWLKGLSDNSGV